MTTLTDDEILNKLALLRMLNVGAWRAVAAFGHAGTEFDHLACDWFGFTGTQKE